MKKAWKRLILAVIPVGAAVIAAVCLSGKGDGREIRFAAVKNESVQSKAAGNSEIEKTTVELSRDADSDRISGTVSLMPDGGSVTAQISGFVLYESGDGFLCVLDGVTDGGRQITVDLSYISSAENLTAVTLGTVGNEEILFFGENSEKIRKLQNGYAETAASVRKAGE